MPKVAAVRLTYNPRTLWFDPAGVEFSRGDALIVRTERGLEYGIADNNLMDVDQESIKALRSPLKPVERVATEEDTASWKDLCRQSEDALPVFRRIVAEQKVDMRPVTVEFLFGGDKAIFYFESDDRVDFRNLVRVLASEFHVHVAMHQIGVRDEARIVGGLGHCGLELCCRRFGGKFNPVSIRMAKDQDLSLNPQKISGVCGRLMCCLRYENDVYKEFKCRCPKMGAKVAVPDGEAKVIEINVPRETVTLLTPDSTRIKVPVDEMTVERNASGNGRPDTVPEDAYFDHADPDAAAKTSSLVDDSIFTGKDTLAERGVVRRGSSRTGRKDASDPSRGRSRRRRSNSSSDTQGSSSSRTPRRRRSSGSAPDASSEGKPSAPRRQPRRRTAERAQDAASRRPRDEARPRRRHEANGQAAHDASSKQPRHDQGLRRSSGARPGQRSSGLSDAKPMPADEHRRARRRSHKTQGKDAPGSES